MRLLPLVAALIAATLVTISGAVAAEEFYLRAGIGLDRPADAAFMDEDCSSASPDALHGCGIGGDGGPRRSLGDFGTVTGVELGLGVTAAPAVRIEALVDHYPRFAFEGCRANFLAPERRQSVSAVLSVLSGMMDGGPCRSARAGPAPAGAVRPVRRVGRHGFRRVFRCTLHRESIGAVEGLAELAAHELAKRRATSGGDQLAAVLTAVRANTVGIAAGANRS